MLHDAHAILDKLPPGGRAPRCKTVNRPTHEQWLPIALVHRLSRDHMGGEAAETPGLIHQLLRLAAHLVRVLHPVPRLCSRCVLAVSEVHDDPIGLLLDRDDVCALSGIIIVDDVVRRSLRR